MTTKKTWGDPYEKWCIAYRGAAQRTERIWFFSSLVIIQSVTADGSLRSPTGGVEGLYPTPHIHEQMTAYIMATTNMNLEPNAMINIDTVAHMNMHYTQY